MEELQEADILWPGDDDHRDEDAVTKPRRKERRARRKSPGPIKTPAKGQASHYWTPTLICDNAGGENDDGGGENDNSTARGIIPPHIIMAQRISDKMAFSVFVGNGRTLKGWDLRRVRTSVLRMTGFVE